MKKYLPTILTIVILLAVGGMVFVPHMAIAASTSIIEGFGVSAMNSIIAWVANVVLGMTAWLVTISGTFLSVSINITTHMKELFFDSATQTSVESIWIIVRDLSSIFIIFSLLFFSIMTILGQSKSGLNQLIINVFIAGLLINFSLFFVKVAVDASNLVSLQFYNAIAPETAESWSTTAAYYDGGLSNIFMQSLRIPLIYQNSGILKAADATLSISFAAVGGIIMMVTAAFSFLAAALAFTARTAIILFVMALSPLYFAGMIFPEIKKDVSDKLLNMLKGQLMFMPIYLFLLYIALRVISDPSFMAIFNSRPAGVAEGSGTLGAISIGVIIQFTIAIIFINAPLIAAIQFGGDGMKWANGITEKIRGVVGRNTLGRASKKGGEIFDNVAASNFAQNNKFGKAAGSVLRTLNISQSIRGGLKAKENDKYGGTHSLADVKKEEKERVQAISKVQRDNAQVAAIKAIVAGTASLIQAETIGKMSKKEIEDTKFDTLKNPQIITKLSSKQFDTLIDGDSLTENQKDEVKNIRKENLQNTLKTSTDPTEIKSILKNLSGKELSKMSPADVLERTEVMDHMKIEHLKAMGETLEATTKQNMRNYIGARPPGTHSASRYVKTSPEWK